MPKYNLKQKIKSALRKIWASGPQKKEALNRAKVAYNGPNKRRKYSIICERCNKTMGLSERYRPINKDGTEAKRAIKVYCVHHLEGMPKVVESWDEYIKKMFCDSDGLVVVCRQCHFEIHGEE